MQVVSVVASVLTLAAVALERFVAVMSPLSAQRSLTMRRTLVCIGLIWTASLAIGAPSYMYRTYTERQWSDFVERHCDDMGWPVALINSDDDGCSEISQPAKRIYHTLIIVMLFFLPIAVMAVTYSIMIGKMCRRDEYVCQLPFSGIHNDQERKGKVVRRKKVYKYINHTF